MIGTYRGKPDSVFIAGRNIKALKYTQGIFGADCEFPEYHQSIIDPKQKLYAGIKWDTTHIDLKNLDYKLAKNNGMVHVSNFPKKQVLLGNIHHFVVWMWDPGYNQLYLNQEVGYKILGIVDAKLALKVMQKTNSNCFDFNQIEKVEYV